jgi:hypothetical protein
MYLDVSTLKRNGHTYKRVLLRESYRDQGKVKKRTLANLSACSDAEIDAIQLALRHKQELALKSVRSSSCCQSNKARRSARCG